MLGEVRQTAEEALGLRGRMICGSKTAYRSLHPDHVAVFNANVCVGGEKVWYGDLDLTLHEQRVRALAERVGGAVHVLYEQDGRFSNEPEPLLSEAIYWIEPGKEPQIDETLVCRDAEGALRWTRWEATR